MNILYTCDNNYVWIMGISMISLFENNKSSNELTVYLLGDSISLENKTMLIKIAEKYDRECIIIDVPKLSIPNVLVSHRWPISAFTRLFCGQLMPENIDKVLYLDCDTIVAQDISDIWNYNMENYIFCGVKDCIGKTYKENIGLLGESVYINAGVILMNLNKLRKLDVSFRIEEYITEYIDFINYADQDILNGIFSEKVGILSPQYNVMTLLSVYNHNDLLVLRSPTNYYSKEEIENAVSNPKIIHYTTCMLTVRPWFSNVSHPFSQEFRKYLKISPWMDRKLDSIDFRTKESKVIGMIQMLPAKFSNMLLGVIHSELKPLLIRVKAKSKYILKRSIK